MLFMSIYTWKPEQRDANQKRFEEGGLLTPEGAKLIGHWMCASGGRAFLLFEAQDVLVISEWCQAWSDLGESDINPVIDTEEMRKTIASNQ